MPTTGFMFFNKSKTISNQNDKSDNDHFSIANQSCNRDEMHAYILDFLTNIFDHLWNSLQGIWSKNKCLKQDQSEDFLLNISLIPSI
mmetsp:Transcript_16453/g.23403  ORF Transcript_16453/g.23403 Transcript_16453/m.23403 type:complete len:87 (-) Transcript_16453:252-512(-)